MYNCHSQCNANVSAHCDARCTAESCLLSRLRFPLVPWCQTPWHAVARRGTPGMPSCAPVRPLPNPGPVDLSEAQQDHPGWDEHKLRCFSASSYDLCAVASYDVVALFLSSHSNSTQSSWIALVCSPAVGAGSCQVQSLRSRSQSCVDLFVRALRMATVQTHFICSLMFPSHSSHFHRSVTQVPPWPNVHRP